MPRDKNTSSLQKRSTVDNKKNSRRTTRVDNLVPEDVLAKQRALEATNRRNQSREERAAALEARRNATPTKATATPKLNHQAQPVTVISPTTLTGTETLLLEEMMVGGVKQFSKEEIKAAPEMVQAIPINGHGTKQSPPTKLKKRENQTIPKNTAPTLIVVDDDSPTPAPTPSEPPISYNKIALQRRRTPTTNLIPTAKPAAPAAPPPAPVPALPPLPTVVLSRRKSQPFQFFMRKEHFLNEKPKGRLSVGLPGELPRSFAPPAAPKLPPDVNPPPSTVPVRQGPTTRPNKKRKREHDSLDVHFGNKHAKREPGQTTRRRTQAPGEHAEPATEASTLNTPPSTELTHTQKKPKTKTQPQLIAEYIATLTSHLLHINTCLEHMDTLHVPTGTSHLHRNYNEEQSIDTEDISSWTDSSVESSGDSITEDMVNQYVALCHPSTGPRGDYISDSSSIEMADESGEYPQDDDID